MNGHLCNLIAVMRSVTQVHSGLLQEWQSRYEDVKHWGSIGSEGQNHGICANPHMC